jgi:hypothetical protein
VGRDDPGWRIGCGGLGLTPPPAWAVGIPADVPRRDVALLCAVAQ